MSAPLLEHEWKARLAAHGLAVARGVFVPAAQTSRLPAIDALRPPLVVKALGRTIVHKTDLGAVRLNVAPGDAGTVIADLCRAMADRGVEPEGFLIEEMAEPGLEVMLGLHTDPVFGRLVAFGLGGTRVEALGEVGFFAAPLRAVDVDTVLASIPWLTAALRRTGEEGIRGLRDALWRFGGPEGLAADASIQSLEVNPLIVNARGAIAVDARGTAA